MRQSNKILVGCFDIGWEQVKLFAITNDTGGDFRLLPSETGPCEINVGIQYDYWREAVSVLFHEVFEFILERKGLRYERTGKLNCDHGDYQFLFTHPEFSDVCSRAALFVTCALPKLADVYDRERTKRQRKAKR